MNRIVLLALPLTLCLACSREEAAPAPEPTPAPATAPAAQPAATPGPAPATASAPAVAPADPESDFDAGAFSGTFAGNGLRLELHADGTYGLEAPDGTSQGSWTHEAGSNTIRLDPGSKTAQDRVFRMSGRNTLADASGATLTRQPAS